MSTRGTVWKTPRECVLLAGLVLGAGCAPTDGGGDVSSLQGVWEVCISRDSAPGVSPLCGQMRARPREMRDRMSGGSATYLALDHDLLLAKLFGEAGTVHRFGSLVVGRDSTLTMLLGVDSTVVVAFDSGIHAQLTRYADSLAGPWTLQCFTGCSDRGRIVLRRHRSTGAR